MVKCAVPQEVQEDYIGQKVVVNRRRESLTGICYERIWASVMRGYVHEITTLSEKWSIISLIIIGHGDH